MIHTNISEKNAWKPGVLPIVHLRSLLYKLSIIAYCFQQSASLIIFAFPERCWNKNWICVPVGLKASIGYVAKSDRQFAVFPENFSDIDASVIF